MGDERPRFRREQPERTGPSLYGLVVLLMIFVAVAVTRPLWMPRLPEGSLIEVVGEVARPGTYLVEPATVRSAAARAGAEIEDDRPVPAGHRVVIAGGQASIEPPGEPLLVGLPVDLNRAGADAIEAIPGIGRSLAEAIVADREARGPFYDLADLRRVPGVGGRALDGMMPFVSLGEPGPRPPPRKLNPNTATAAELERLPGIGPVTAARIVVHREDAGPFRTVGDLERVRGIGPVTVERLTPLLEIE